MLKEEHGTLFATLVTQVTLPALIFDALAHSSFEWEYIRLFVYLFLSEIFLLLFAWGVGKGLKLTAQQMGSFLLVSTFGSSALLGYALIEALYPQNFSALTEGAFISELGVGLPLFTIGVMIMMHYGQKRQTLKYSFQYALHFFKSPLFIAIVLGLLWSFSPLKTEKIFTAPLFDAIHIIAKANTFLVALTVGVLLNFTSLHHILGITLATVAIKLFLSPLLLYFPAHFLSLESWQLQVLLLESAMPSAMLSVVLAKQYGCDAKLAAQLVFITLIVSTVTVSFMIHL